MAENTKTLPVDRLKQEAQGFGDALKQRGFAKVSEGVESLTGRLGDIADGSTAGQTAKNMGSGDSPLKAGLKAKASKLKDTVKDKLGGGGGGGDGKKLKVTHIYEHVDVPVSREVAYQQWTQFEDFPDFTKKVEDVTQEEDEKVRWKAQILWSHRTWEADIVDQVPNERIVWKSKGEKGHVDGAVTFHELAPELTRILMVLEYHPQGFFEHTGNLWRAQGRRARLELKHFARHVATHTLIHQDEVDGWDGEIRDGEVTDKAEKAESDEESSDNGSSGKRSSGKRSSSKKSSAKKSAPKKSASSRSGTKKSASKSRG